MLKTGNRASTTIGWPLAEQRPTARFGYLNWREFDADATDLLMVASVASLFTRYGGGHQVNVNKQTVTDIARLLFQTGFSGGAELGLSGDDALSFKVSANGASWITGLEFDPETGQASVPSGLEVAGQITGAAVTLSATNSTFCRLLKVGDYGIGANADGVVTDLDSHFSSGSSCFYGGAHGSAPSGDNPLPNLNGAAGIWCGTTGLLSADSFVWQIAYRFSGAPTELRARKSGPGRTIVTLKW